MKGAGEGQVNEVALLQAAEDGHLQMVRFHLRRRRRASSAPGGSGLATTARDMYGATPLLRASEKGHLAVVRVLLHEGGARYTSLFSSSHPP